MKRIITVIIKALVIEPHNKIRINEELLNIQDIILEDVILKKFFSSEEVQKWIVLHAACKSSQHKTRFYRYHSISIIYNLDNLLITLKRSGSIPLIFGTGTGGRISILILEDN